MPMLLAGEPIGAITLSWAKPRAVTTITRIELVQTFADQAVIAIENARLFPTRPMRRWKVKRRRPTS